MVAPAHLIPASLWDDAARVGLISMKSLVPQILARYAIGESSFRPEPASTEFPNVAAKQAPAGSQSLWAPGA